MSRPTHHTWVVAEEGTRQLVLFAALYSKASYISRTPVLCPCTTPSGYSYRKVLWSRNIINRIASQIMIMASESSRKYQNNSSEEEKSEEILLRRVAWSQLPTSKEKWHPFQLVGVLPFIWTAISKRQEKGFQLFLISRLYITKTALCTWRRNW